MGIDLTWDIVNLGVYAWYLRMNDTCDIPLDRGSTSGRSLTAGTRLRWRARCRKYGG